jgi:hypothetical protein
MEEATLVVFCWKSKRIERGYIQVDAEGRRQPETGLYGRGEGTFVGGRFSSTSLNESNEE